MCLCVYLAERDETMRRSSAVGVCAFRWTRVGLSKGAMQFLILEAFATGGKIKRQPLRDFVSLNKTFNVG